MKLRFSLAPPGFFVFQGLVSSAHATINPKGRIYQKQRTKTIVHNERDRVNPGFPIFMEVSTWKINFSEIMVLP